jgi:hypothetical protein
MAYARFLKSDLYVIMSSGGFLFCVTCSLLDDMNGAGYSAYNTQDMIDHIKQHEEAGHRVPEDIYEELLKDDAENFPKPTQNTQPSPTPPLPLSE